MKTFDAEMNVLQAAQKRMADVFDHFDDIVVSVSSGKDSTVLYWLALIEAQNRNRKITVFFLDQEAEYRATIELMDSMMRHKSVIPNWYQVPIYMTNATSYTSDLLFAWGDGEQWIREKSPIAVHSIEGKYPKRFYDFFPWYETQFNSRTAFLVGLRAEESLNRYRAIAKNPGYLDWNWSTAAAKPGSCRFYPIYDWGNGDVWKFIADTGVPYNRIYDLMWMNNQGYYNTLRVSNLIHEKSFSCLSQLQKLEPDTYEAMIRRISGIEAAAKYAEEAFIYSGGKLPQQFQSWIEYRDYLIDSAPIDQSKKDRIRRRWKPNSSESQIRQQVRQVLTCDWENNLPVSSSGGKAKERAERLRERWFQRL